MSLPHWVCLGYCVLGMLVGAAVLLAVVPR
jgi:hypothetical protein